MPFFDSHRRTNRCRYTEGKYAPVIRPVRSLGVFVYPGWVRGYLLIGFRMVSFDTVKKNDISVSGKALDDVTHARLMTTIFLGALVDVTLNKITTCWIEENQIILDAFIILNKYRPIPNLTRCKNNLPSFTFP